MTFSASEAVLALVSRNVQLKCAIRDEYPEGVPGKFLHLLASWTLAAQGRF